MSFQVFRFSSIVSIITGLVHILIGIVELFLWMNPVVHARLDFDFQQALSAREIVMNAGLYNLFIAAGLLWAGVSFFGALPKLENPLRLQLFFFVCVAIAGIFGAFTLPRNTTLLLQTLPGVIGIGLTLKGLSSNMENA